MAIGWFLVPYVRDVNRPAGMGPARYCSIADQQALIDADGGKWAESEVLGNVALVKVRASNATLTTLDNLYFRLPNISLDTLLSGLTTTQRNQLRAKVEELGYTQEEIQSALGTNLGQRSLRQVLKFVTGKRRKVRFDQLQNDFVFDGPIVTPRPLEEVDAEVQP
jgi:hypothetical protein